MSFATPLISIISIQTYFSKNFLYLLDIRLLFHLIE